MNPFKVLHINKQASKKEIIQAAALEMRNKKHSAKEIAQAQKMLLDPVSRACQEFLYCVDLTDAKERLRQKIIENSGNPDSFEPSEGSQLKYLTSFEKNHEH